jgi:hypothetical protein
MVVIFIFNLIRYLKVNQRFFLRLAFARRSALGEGRGWFCAADGVGIILEADESFDPCS